MKRISGGRPGERLIYFTGAVCFLLAAWFSVGYYHPDEHFQILEFASLKLGMNTPAGLPWEYSSAMRPAIQPLTAFLLYRMMEATGLSDPFITAFLLRVLTAGVTLLSIHLLIRLYREQFPPETTGTGFLLLSFLLWFVVFNAVRFSSDTLSGRIFTIGFALFLLEKQENGRKYLLTGLCLGLSFLVRYQMILMIAGFMAWLLVMKKAGLRNLAIMTGGILLIFAAGVVSDHWLYGRWTLTIWNYFSENILQDKASGFGVSPWYGYFTEVFMNGVPPFSLVYILAVAGFFILKPKDILTWTLIPFLLVHFLVSHKELRFLFPMIGFLPVMIMVCHGKLKTMNHGKVMKNRIVKIFIILFWTVNFTLLPAVIFRPADDGIPVFRALWQAPAGPVIVYYDDQDPFQTCYSMTYYRRPGLSTRKTDSIGQIKTPADTAIYFVTTRQPVFRSAGIKSEPVYVALPEWLKFFNINGWIERTRFWRVYRIRC